MSWQGFEQSAPFDKPPANNPFKILIDFSTEFTLSLPAGHLERAPNDRLTRAATLFSRENVERFMGHYFRDYCPHSPILHPGTSQASSASSFLLTVVVVTGDMFSSCANNIDQARNIHDLVEDYVRSNAIFRKPLSGTETLRDSTDLEAFQALEAAFFITQVQLQEGSPSKRKDARNFRFKEIIYAVRALGFLESHNPFFHVEPPMPEKFQWSQYGDGETMIPRLFAEEMDIHMPGPAEASFADNAQAYYQLSLKEHGLQNLRLSQICDAFLQDKWNEQMRSSMQTLSILSLFSLILALLQILWLSPYRPRKCQTMERMTRALDRWKQVWDFQNSTVTPRQRERYGYLKTAPLEFGQIVSLLVKKKSTRLDTAGNLSTITALNKNQYAHALLETVDKEQV